jgi:glycosyltransferase involved in cell wall biosynthesis
MNINTNPTKILYLCGGRSFFFKNLSRKIEEVAACWLRIGHKVKQVYGGDISSVCSATNNEDSYGSQETYVRWYRKTARIAPLVASISEWRDIKHDRLILKYLTELCRGWKPDIVWERSCRLHFAGLVFARRIGVPYVLEWKDHLVNYRFSFFRGKAIQMEARKNREADHVVVESNVLRDKFSREGIDIGKIIVAHNGVQVEQFSRDEQKRKRIRKDLGVEDDMVLVGYLGSYAFYHDTGRLVRAAEILGKKNTAKKLKILMVGAGKEYTATRNLAEDFGLLENILVMKPGVPKGEVPGVLAALDIAVLPGSTDIICPIKIQEYMACELPSVVPDYACNREVIDDNQTGIMFQPKNEASLAEKISVLAEDEQRRLCIGREARREVERRFTWEKTWGAALEEVLKKI